MKKKISQNDVSNKSQSWVYSEVVKDHFLNPRFFVKGDRPEWRFNGVGEVGSPACGDVMRFWIAVDDDKNINQPDQQKIVRVGWKTFGCASAIASTSVLAERLVADGGMTLSAARKIRPQDIVEWLGGLPVNKIHCSVLGDQALRQAIDNYIKNKKEN